VSSNFALALSKQRQPAKGNVKKLIKLVAEWGKDIQAAPTPRNLENHAAAEAEVETIISAIGGNLVDDIAEKIMDAEVPSLVKKVKATKRTFWLQT
jgi:hypothetical protein